MSNAMIIEKDFLYEDFIIHPYKARTKIKVAGTVAQ